MQINSSNNVAALYGVDQTSQKTQPEKAEQLQSPSIAQKTDSVSISSEAIRKQAETKKQEVASTKNIEQAQQQNVQTSTAPPAKNSAAQRIDLMA